MTNDEFLDLLNAALDDRRPVDSDPTLLARAAEDATCREMLEGYRALQEGLRQRQSQPAAAPSADFAQRILAQLHTTPAHLPDDSPTVAASSRWVIPLTAVLALAAALVLAVWPLLMNSPTPNQPSVAVTPPPENRPPENRPPENPVAVTPPVVVPEEEPPATPLPVLVREVEDHYLMLAQDTRASLSELALLLPSPLTKTASTETASANVWLDQVGEQFRPLKSSMSGAFDFLIESLPMDEPPAS